MPITHESILTPNPNVVYTELQNGEAVLLHTDTLDYYTLNATGVQVWDVLQQGGSPQAAAQTLTSHYDVSYRDAEMTVILLAEELLKEQLLTAAEA